MPDVVNTRAMTSKQAKAAYKKAGGPRFTEKELRQQKRATELYEREQRIKEKDKMKRENKIKRLKKEEKEKEARRKAGLPEKPEGYFSPRQCRLGMFFGRGKEDDPSRQSRDSTIERDNSRETTIEKDEGDCDLDWDPTPPTKGEEPDQPGSTPKDPVPEEKILLEINPTRPCQALPQANKFTVLLDDLDWLDRLPSNTQVERELSSDIEPLPPRSQPPAKSPRTKPAFSSQYSTTVVPQANVVAALAHTSSQVGRELSGVSGPLPPRSQPAAQSQRTNLASSQHLATMVRQADFEATLALFSSQDFNLTTEEMQDLTTPAKF